MNVIALTLTTLGLVALAQANADYNLRCTKREIGIRWPSYSSNSEYYVCDGVGGNLLTISCKSGDVFTFVLQLCTSPSRYIPAPPLDVLPVSPHSVPPQSPNPLPIEIMQPEQNPTLPRPLYPSNVPSFNSMQPPVVMDQRPPTQWEMPVVAPPHANELEPHLLVPPMEQANLLTPPERPMVGGNVPPLLEQAKPLIPALPSETGSKPEPPMPPTPAPTPPAIPNKKQPAAPGISKKKKAPLPSKKTPVVSQKTPVPSKKTSVSSKKTAQPSAKKDVQAPNKARKPLSPQA